jgi:hypothetical protein
MNPDQDCLYLQAELSQVLRFPRAARRRFLQSFHARLDHC